jgi:hypothetical protein
MEENPLDTEISVERALGIGGGIGNVQSNC